MPSFEAGVGSNVARVAKSTNAKAVVRQLAAGIDYRIPILT